MLSRYFNFKELNTSLKTELLAGITTFLTMSYVLVINPKLLSLTGIPFESAFVSTLLISFVGCLFMGLYAKLPFAIASYVGESAFVAYTAVKVSGYTWQQALGVIFLCGILLFLLTITNVRTYVVNSIPMSIKLAFTSGLGLFLALIALGDIGVVKFINGSYSFDFSKPLELGLALFNILLISFLMSKKIKSGILVGILTTAFIGGMIGIINFSYPFFSVPQVVPETIGGLDLKGVLNLQSLPLIFITFTIVFADTMGTLIGVSYKANLLDENKNLPNCKKPMLVDSITTMLASYSGTTTTGVYLESAAGIEAGGKSGLTAIVVGVLMFASMFFAPLIGVLPPFTYAGALFVIGMSMMTTMRELPLKDYSEVIPVLVVLFLVLFTFNSNVVL